MDQHIEHTAHDDADATETYQPQAPTSTNTANSILIPVAILLGFGMIAAAIFFSGTGKAPQYAIESPDSQGNIQQNDPGNPDNVNPVDENDWIRGNPNAPIKIVEYSDYDCPFCKLYHETMQQIISEYGPTGEVAWVYRHLPLAQLHPNAPQLAVAAECAGKLGGTEAFWTFSDLIFDERDTNQPTDISRLPEFAAESGVDVAAFESCVENGDTVEDVQADFENALAVGGNQIGTPHSIVVVGDQTGVIRGAQDYAAVKQIVENLIAQLNGTSE